MPEFTPPPPVVDNWRDHTNWDGPVCEQCGHPLWAQSSVEAGVCASCRPMSAFVVYDGAPELRVVSD